MHKQPGGTFSIIVDPEVMAKLLALVESSKQKVIISFPDGQKYTGDLDYVGEVDPDGICPISISNLHHASN